MILTKPFSELKGDVGVRNMFGLRLGAASSSFPTTNKTVYSSAGDTTLVIPAGVYFIGVKQWGAGGGGGNNATNGGEGGPGSFVQARIAVTPGESITIRNGGKGKGGTTGSAPTGGTPGNGGDGGTGSTNGNGGSGGGYSAILRGSTPLLVAPGGGGGGARQTGYDGGDGGPGGSPGEAGTGGGSGGAYGGGVGGQTDGGVGGIEKTPVTGNTFAAKGGSLDGGDGGSGGSGFAGGGGGGGGYFGGGGGGRSDSGSAGGGGGGSPYIEPTATFQVIIHSTSKAAPNTSDPDYTAGAAVGGNKASDGFDGLTIITY